MRALFSFLLWMAACGTAHAQQLHVDPADDPCLNIETLRARIHHWLQGQRFDDTRVIVHAADTPAGFSLTRGDGSIAERRFETLPATCSDRVDAISLAIAIALEQPSEPSPATTEPAPEADAAHAIVTPPEPVPENPSDVLGDREIGRDDRVRLHASLIGMLGVLPAAALGVGLGLEAPVASATRVSIAAMLAPSTSVALDTFNADTQLIAARGLLCTSAWDALVDVEGCGGMLAGVLRASGVDTARNRDVTLGLVAVIARAAVRFPAQSRVSGRLALDLALNVLRPELIVHDTMRLTRSSGIVGGALSFDVIVTL